MRLATLIRTVAALRIITCCKAVELPSLQRLGRVVVDPASVFLMGSDISISCVLLVIPCQVINFQLNMSGSPDIYMKRLNNTVARYRIAGFNILKSSLMCYVNCVDGRKHFVCGASLSPGYPPDPPQELRCVWRQNVMKCIWRIGNPPILDTSYTLHVQDVRTNVEKIFTTDLNSSTASSTPQSLLDNGQYRVHVVARNLLGNASSDILTFSMQNIGTMMQLIPGSRLLMSVWLGLTHKHPHTHTHT
uniref:Fibronectin type-III domain-containing protein n=1 Tax=Callorhinchus milii TaxID=7868 RepID=A0A4W3J4R3_CALMI